MNGLRFTDWLMLALSVAAILRFWLAHGWWQEEARRLQEAAESYRKERDFWRAEAGRLRDLVDADIAELEWEEDPE